MKHRYPQTLVRFQHLEGGSYGTLTLVARDRDTLEVQLGNDFVRINADGASQIAQALECFAGPSPEVLVEVEADVEESEVVVEREAPKGLRPRAASRRRAT